MSKIKFYTSDGQMYFEMEEEKVNKEQKIQELTERIEKSQAELDELKKELEKLQKKPYEISYPEDGTEVYYIDDYYGEIDSRKYDAFHEDYKHLYDTGLYFDTEEEAEQFLKEQTLIKKIKCYTKEQQGDWEPDWSNFNEEKWRLQFSAGARVFTVIENRYYVSFTNFLIFKSKEIAQACIDEFGDEIVEVFC